MKVARKHFEALALKDDSQRRAYIEAMNGIELLELLHYADAREESDLRNEVIMRVLGVSGRRYLAKQAAKAAKKAKRIF